MAECRPLQLPEVGALGLRRLACSEQGGHQPKDQNGEACDNHTCMPVRRNVVHWNGLLILATVLLTGPEVRTMTDCDQLMGQEHCRSLLNGRFLNLKSIRIQDVTSLIIEIDDCVDNQWQVHVEELKDAAVAILPIFVVHG